VISNYFDINLLSVDQIERIEILKGGHSTLYGSDAVAGVVNIISRKVAGGSSKPFTNASIAAGSYGTLRSSAGISLRRNKADYLLQLSNIRSQGFSAATDSTKQGNFDKNNYRQETVRGQVGVKTGQQSKLTFSGLYSHYKTELDAAAFVDEKDFISKNTNKQIGLGWNRKTQLGTLQFNYQYNWIERSYIDDSNYIASMFTSYSNSNYVGRTHFAELYATRNIGNWELLTGLDYRKNSTTQKFFSTGIWGPYTSPELNASMDQLSGYASIVYKKNRVALEAGGRLNSHSEYGTHGTFTLNPSYRLNAKTKLFANFYTAYKVPTLYQLFDSYAGNDSLRPEKGFIQEIGIDWMLSKKIKGRLVGFNRKSDQTIIYTYDPQSWSGKYLNASQQTNYGVELEALLHLKPVTLLINYAYTDGKTTSAFDGTGTGMGKDSSYFNLYRIPKHALNIQATWQQKNWLVTLSGRVASKREEFIYGDKPVVMKGYATIDLYTEYRVNQKGLRLFADLRNLTNTRYEEIRGYNTRGFNFMAGVLFGR
jgi:vitamin B12 transporter